MLIHYRVLFFSADDAERRANAGINDTQPIRRQPK